MSDIKEIALRVAEQLAELYGKDSPALLEEVADLTNKQIAREVSLYVSQYFGPENRGRIDKTIDAILEKWIQEGKIDIGKPSPSIKHTLRERINSLSKDEICEFATKRNLEMWRMRKDGMTFKKIAEKNKISAVRARQLIDAIDCKLGVFVQTLKLAGFKVSR